MIIIRDKDTRDQEILLAIDTVTTTTEDIKKIISEIWNTEDGYELDDLYDRLPDDCVPLAVEELLF